MPPIDRPWDGKTPLGGAETFELLSGETGKPLIDPVEFMDWVAAHGLNAVRLMPFRRHDQYPPWGSQQWWHRVDRFIRLGIERGIYVIFSAWPGVHPHDILQQAGMDACEEFTRRFSIEDYPNLICEPGNEIKFPSYDDGSMQVATNIFDQAGFPTIHCPSDETWDQVDHAGIRVDATAEGYDDETHSSAKGRLVFTDHNRFLLIMRRTSTKIAAVRRMRAEGAIGFIGSGTWTDSDGVVHSLAGWHRPLDEQFLEPEVLKVISEEFAQGEPVEPPVPRYEALARAINDRDKYANAHPWQVENWAPGDWEKYLERVERVFKEQERLRREG